jgi:cyanophycin synthetase
VDIQELAAVAAHTFDWIIVREDEDLRRREPGEVAHLIADTIARTRPSLPMTIIPDEGEAVAQALDMARDGDLVVIFVDRVEESIEQVKEAARALAREESGSFWVPMPAGPARSHRGRMEPGAQVAGLGEDEEMRAGEDEGHEIPGAAWNGRAGGEAGKARASAWNLPEMKEEA